LLNVEAVTNKRLGVEGLIPTLALRK
jgi:hypothetical protein